MIALGNVGETGWTLAHLDLGLIRAVQTEGQVLNRRDWSRGEFIRPHRL